MGVVGFNFIKMAPGFRSSTFDPMLIIAQIIALQTCFYASLSILIIAGDYIGDIRCTVAQIFYYKKFEDPVTSWYIIGATLLNSIICAFALWWIVGRAKKCLDFTATMYILHFVFCLAFGGFPLSLWWWLTNIVALIVTTLISEWLSWRTELKAIPLSGSTNTSTA